jgi:hypothetical protein
MFRKSIIAVVLGVALLFLFFTLVSADGQKEVYQMDMNTPTAAPLPVESTPVPDLPLSGAQAGTGTCPMMSGTGMTGTGNMSGMGMGNMAGMQGMSGMNMGTMSGMQGMQNMPGGMMNMGGMAGMNMTNMNGSMAAYATPWYSNPWLMLGWVLLVLVVLAVLAGIVLMVQTLRRRSESVVPVEKS